MTPSSTRSRPTIDVSALPESLIDHRSSIWWANLLLLAIETTMFALLFASYFYYRGNFQLWPPPQSNWTIERLNSDPALLWGTINVLIIIASCAPMLWADRSAFAMNERGTLWGLVLCLVTALVAIGIRFHEFWTLNYRWDDNAYASTVWTLLGLHLTHLVVGSLENIIMIAWLACKGMDAKHARDVRVNAVYWYWIGAMGVLVYAIVYGAPKVL